MKNYQKTIIKLSMARYAGALLLLLWMCSNIVLTGCKQERLFVHIDSTAAVPPQFHFFNSYSYDNAMKLSVDGVPRENVNKYTFSAYYPSSSAFNLNTAVANSKLININDPAQATLHANAVSNSTFQFKQNTSYVLVAGYTAFDTVTAPLKTNVPVIAYYPEDINHPFDGTTGVRWLNLIASSSGGTPTLTITPNVGKGTSLKLNQVPAYSVSSTNTAANYYSITQPGLKNLTLIMGTGSPYVQFKFLPVQLDNSKNYTFFAVGDLKNFLAGLQPIPQMFVTEDGNPSSLKQLTLSSVSYPNNISSTAQVTVINDAYNIPGLLLYGSSTANGWVGVEYKGLDVLLNQVKMNVLRWPIYNPGTAGSPDQEDVGDAYTQIYSPASFPNNLLNRIATNSNITPGSFKITVTPGGAYTPVYETTNYNFEQGNSYSVCLLPNNNTNNSCGALILQNDLSPNTAYFKLRFINILGGSTQVDVHSGSPSGPVIAAGIAYGQDNPYINLAPNLSAQSLYITAAGSTTPLFQVGSGAAGRPISLAFTPGNSGTIFLMGLLPGTTPYAGDKDAFGPYVYYHSDAFINSLTVLPTAQLYY